ncbi:MAG: biotin--[acetyl-CoA-carboxylase] ligase [Oscillospiraceae bacterium]
MSTKTDILTILENQRESFLSGQELAEQLNISRNSVWKAIKSLQEDGHSIHAVQNKGYRLDENSDLLSEEGIRLHLPEELKSIGISVFKTLDSTNTQAKKLALEGAPHGTVILGEEQTAGRGRFGKGFVSPPSGGLYMSIILKPTAETAEPQLITVAAAVAACRAIEKESGLTPQIKWVNDLYLNGKKICGILSEAVADFESGTIESIVVGIGINCTTKPESFPKALREIAGSLDAKGLSRNRLAADIIGDILSGFQDLKNPRLMEEYRRRSLMLGREISFERDGETMSALVTGINDMGNLLVRRHDGTELVLLGGEVSLGRLPE